MINALKDFQIMLEHLNKLENKIFQNKILKKIHCAGKFKKWSHTFYGGTRMQILFAAGF